MSDTIAEQTISEESNFPEVEPATETTALETPVEPPADDIETEETPVEDSSNPAATKARKDAAKYRERLRESESQTATHAATIDQLRRQIIDGITEAAGIKPTALWAAGTELSDLLDADGIIDPDAVATAVNATRAALGIPRFKGEGNGAARPRQVAPTSPDNWGSLLNTP